MLGPLARNIFLSTGGAYRVYFVLDDADQQSLATLCTLEDRALRWVWKNGSFPVKTNEGVFAGDSPFVLLTGDDVVFHDNWLPPVLEAFEDPNVMVVGTRDLSPITADGSHVTMPVLRRSYIEGIGAAWNESPSCFHEGYHHNYSETETWQLAQHRGVAKFVPESIVEHKHPDWGTREPDSTDAKGGQANKQQDHELFELRRAEWLAS